MSTDDEVLARVARGAAWLDADRPGWADVVNLQILATGYESLGAADQVYGSWGVAREMVPNRPRSDYGVALPYGEEPTDAAWARIDDAWRAEVLKRRTPGR